MGKNESFRVKISSDFEEFWRYNVLGYCGCFDEEGNRVEYHAIDDTIAPLDSDYDSCPEGCPLTRSVEFETVESRYMQLFIYVLPHSIHLFSVVEKYPPYILSVQVWHGERLIIDKQVLVNCWSGAEVELFTEEYE